MKQILQASTLVLFLAIPNFVNAEWSTSGGYASYNNFELGVVYSSVARGFKVDKWEFTPEVRLGVGTKDSDLRSLVGFVGETSTLEVDSFISASLRGGYNISKDFNLFIQPSYSRLKVTASNDEFSESSDEWEFNVGVGASYDINDSVSMELLFEPLYNDDVFTLALRYEF